MRVWTRHLALLSIKTATTKTTQAHKTSGSRSCCAAPDMPTIRLPLEYAAEAPYPSTYAGVVVKEKAECLSLEL